jgi:hypothetical protein
MKMKLEHNAKHEYKPFHVGNLPLNTDGKPVAGVFRMIWPSEADWTDNPMRPTEEDLNKDLGTFKSKNKAVTIDPEKEGEEIIKKRLKRRKTKSIIN